MSYFFFLYRSPLSLFTVFDAISWNIYEVLSINLSAKCIYLWNFNDCHKDWLTYSSGTDRPGELCYKCFISNDLAQMINFPSSIPDCDSHSLVLLDLFISSDASICSTMAFPALVNCDQFVVSVSINFQVNLKRDVPWENIFKLRTSAAASKFLKGFTLQLMHISLIVNTASIVFSS